MARQSQNLTRRALSEPDPPGLECEVPSFDPPQFGESPPERLMHSERHARSGRPHQPDAPGR